MAGRWVTNPRRLEPNAPSQTAVRYCISEVLRNVYEATRSSELVLARQWSGFMPDFSNSGSVGWLACRARRSKTFIVRRRAPKGRATRPLWFSLLAWLRGLDLNQRPLGYEPNELPGCSTPR